MSTGAALLLVEDDVALRASLRLALLDEDFRVFEAGTGREAMAWLQAGEPPDGVLLDLGLPDLDGIEVCRHARAVTAAPIVVVTARTRPEDFAAAVAAGADDYLPKPFPAGELASRVRALLAPARRPAQDAQRAVGLEFDAAGDTVRVLRRQVPLTRVEFRLLCELAADPGRPLPASKLQTQVWGRDQPAGRTILTARMASLRGKLAASDGSRRWIRSGGGSYLLDI